MTKFVVLEDINGNDRVIFDLHKVSFVAKDGETNIEMVIDSFKRIFEYEDKQQRDNAFKRLVDDLLNR